MVQSVKQCAGCGAQMGARGRVCPRCGRGSLFGELIWIAVLGVLLLGIGVFSGLISLDEIREVTRRPVADSSVERTGHPKPARPVRHSTHGGKNRVKAPAEKTATSRDDTAMAFAPCPSFDSTYSPSRHLAHAPPASPAHICADSYPTVVQSAPTVAESALSH